MLSAAVVIGALRVTIGPLVKKLPKIQTVLFLLTGIYDDDPEIITLSRADFGKLNFEQSRFLYTVELNLNGSNPDGSFTLPDLNSLFGPWSLVYIETNSGRLELPFAGMPLN